MLHKRRYIDGYYLRGLIDRAGKMSGLFTSNDIDELDEDADRMDVDVKDNNNSNNGNEDSNDIEKTNNKEQLNNKTDKHSKKVKEGNNNDNNTNEDEIDNQNFSLPNIPQLTRADKTLDELLDLLDDPDFTPIIPDAVTDYYISKSGLDLNFLSNKNNSNIEAKKIKRLLALATQKFISDIATDAYEYSRIRSNSAVYSANNPQSRSRALLMATMAKAKGGNNNNNTNNTNNDDSNGNTEDSNNNNNNGNNNDDVNINGNNLNPTGANQNKEKVTLTIEDLSSALDEYGLNVTRPQFYR